MHGNWGEIVQQLRKNFREEGCSWYQDVRFVKWMVKILITCCAWHCPFARQLWEWITSKFQLRNNFSSLTQARRMAQGSSVLVRHMWEAVVVDGMVALWFHKNKEILDQQSGVLLIEIIMGIGVSTRECKGLGVETNYIAKCYAILENAEIAIEKGWLNL
ncbi:hypothetical protein IFM89_015197 [Coptis chinensis]|uniref:Uncharacterized protein n=1 Tax=Coptis chinensis TaxID=261450 RepID=A0A835HET0_9MAGN|nr:hypothetical protein IFM89_015197 [Coptis chinensis]